MNELTKGWRTNDEQIVIDNLDTEIERLKAKLEARSVVSRLQDEREQAKDAEIERLKVENAILKANIAAVNNYDRHKFSETVENATDELFKKLAYHGMIKERSDVSPTPQ